MTIAAEQELAKQIAVLEQTMETHKQEYKTDIARLAEQIAKRDIERDAEAHKRDKDNLRWQIGLWVAAIVILGFIIRFPGVPAVTN